MDNAQETLGVMESTGSEGEGHSCKVTVEGLQEKEGGIAVSSLGAANEEGFDEELSVLPRHTKVVVTGNNRTKSVLVGLHGVVKKAVGLGGWHWLVLTNGLEVKLQRNALSVLEPPTGLEEDDDSDGGRSNVEDYPKPCKVRMRHPKSNGMTRGGSVQKWHVADASSTGPKANQKLLKVNLSKLETAALVRYLRRFELTQILQRNNSLMLWRGISVHSNWMNFK
ncbi:hypothetical protein KP509_07G066600 [Ceratopteris richardii]|uniref:Histone deacetylase complex subunit SAP30 Sin3 binding domain-containing protein n=1 Tax=Ceratopteris richardii TaxID=49495 RepID=A0A8T2UBQ7_CERRI|nr:hypothetical protein KP509_07G066600 [Ceratopteris richardii]